jgi:hypothetical protein
MREWLGRFDGALLGTFVLTVTLGMLAAGPALAHDDEGEDDGCRPACNEVRRVCKEAGKTSFRSCVKECRGARKAGGCYEACREEHSAERETCKVECRDCKEGCEPGGGGCEAECAAELARCASGLRKAAKECAGGCTEVAREAFHECFEGDDPLTCLLEVTGDLAACLGECADVTREGTAACTEVAEACREQCNVGSASRAFLDPPETLLD